MASMVTIQVRIDDGNSQQVIDKIDASLASLGTGGTASLQRVGHAAGELDGHFTTALDNVRLLSQSLGFRLSRAMESALSRFPALTNALGQFSGALLAINAGEIFLRMGTELYHLEQNFLSIQSPVDKFYETLKKTSELDFTNTHSLATTQFRLDQATTQMARLPSDAQGLQRSGLLGMVRDLGNPNAIGADIVTLLQAHDTAQQGATASGQMIELTRRQIDQTHEQALAKIELAHANDALYKSSQPLHELQKEQAINAENRSYQNKLDKFYGNGVPGNAGAAEEQQKNAEAAAKASEQMTEMSRRERDERIKAQDDAINSGLEGEALYRAQLEQSIAAITRKFQDGEITKQTAIAETNSLQEKYSNEEADRIQKQLDASQKMLQDAQIAGLSGAAKIQAEHGQRINEINSDRTLDPQAASLQRQAAAVEANDKLQKLDDDFTQHTQEMVNQRTDATLSGFAKIDAAAQQEHTKLQKLYDDTFNAEHPANADQQKQFSDAGAAIDADATQKKSDLSAKNQADDLASAREASQAEARVREQGITGWVASYKDAIAEIQMQEQERLAKLQEDAQKEGLTWQEAAQRRENIEATAGAQISEQNQQLQHTIAGQLQQAFTDPTAFIKQKMQQMFFEILADWIMRLNVFKGVFGDTMGGMQPGAPGSTSGRGGTLGAAARSAFGIGHGISTGAPAGTRGFGNFGSFGTGAGAASSTGASAHGGYGFPASSSDSSSIGASSNGGYGFPQSSGDYSSGTWSSPDVTFPTFGGAFGAGAGISPSLSSGAAASAGSGASANDAHSGPAPSYGNRGVAGIGNDVTSITGDATSLMRTFGMGSRGGQANAIPGVSVNSDGTTVFGDAGVGGGGTSGLPGDAGTGSAAANGLSTALGMAGAVGGAYAGTEGVIDSFHQGGLNGALKATMSGAEMGAAVGSIIPGLGTVVGGAVGAAIGLGVNLTGDIMGEAGKFAARDYYKSTLFPQLEDIEKQFNSGGGGDYLAAISKANSTEATGMSYMSMKWGSDAANWVKANYLDKETQKVVGDITRLAGGGREYMAKTAAEFHTGGQITSFHDFATSTNEGFIHAMLGEGIVNTNAMNTHAPMVHAMNAGADPVQMASMYLQASGSRSAGASSVNYHTHNYSALDMKSFKQFLDGGGTKTINEAQNRRAALYAGDAIG